MLTFQFLTTANKCISYSMVYENHHIILKNIILKIHLYQLRESNLPNLIRTLQEFMVDRKKVFS